MVRVLPAARSAATSATSEVAEDGFLGAAVFVDVGAVLCQARLFVGEVGVGPLKRVGGDGVEVGLGAVAVVVDQVLDEFLKFVELARAVVGGEAREVGFEVLGVSRGAARRRQQHAVACSIQRA